MAGPNATFKPQWSISPQGLQGLQAVLHRMQNTKPLEVTLVFEIKHKSRVGILSVLLSRPLEMVHESAEFSKGVSDCILTQAHFRSQF